MGKYQAYPEYKSSGVEWLGEVPSNWQLTRIKYIAELTPKKPNIDRTLECSFVPMEKLKTNSVILDEARLVHDVYDGYTCFRDGDILMAKVTPCFENKNIAIAEGLINRIGFGSSEIYVIRTNELATNRYWYYRLQEDSFMDIATAAMTGAGGLKRVPSDVVNNFTAALPSNDEQQQIANFLDHETAKIDVLIEKQQQLIQLLKEKRQAIICHAVTKGLNPNAPMKDSGVEWLGVVPEHWDVKKIAHLAMLKSGEAIVSEQIEPEGEYPVFGGNGLRGFTSSHTHDGSYVLIGRQGALCGNINYANGKFWASEHAVVVYPIMPMNIDWLGELLRSMNLNQYNVSAAQPGLAVSNIVCLKIPFPHLEEQREIANYIIEESKKIERLFKKAEDAILLMQERRTALISASVTGKIDVRNWQAEQQ